MVQLTLTRRTVALVVAVFAAVACLAAVAFVRTAQADHRFNDIADGTFFHDSTAWLADNGIADGFADGSFGPKQNITRGQASYWFKNFNDNVVAPHVDDTTDVHGIADTSALATDTDVSSAITAYNDSIEVVSTSLAGDETPVFGGRVLVPCPAGKRAISGGINWDDDFQSTWDFHGHPESGGWRLIYFTRDGSPQPTLPRTAFVICIPTQSG